MFVQCILIYWELDTSHLLFYNLWYDSFHSSMHHVCTYMYIHMYIINKTQTWSSWSEAACWRRWGQTFHTTTSGSDHVMLITTDHTGVWWRLAETRTSWISWWNSWNIMSINFISRLLQCVWYQHFLPKAECTYVWLHFCIKITYVCM